MKTIKILVIVFSIFMTLGCNLNSKLFTVTYESCYGDIPNQITVEEGYILTSTDLPALEFKSFKFLGWSVDDSLILADEYIVQKDVVLTGLWDAQVKINFDSNGGSDIDPMFIEPGTVFDEITVPEREGYDFVCWCTEDGKEFDFSSEIDNDITLYAKWERKVLTVVFYDSNKTIIITENYNYGDLVNKRVLDSTEDYTFLGFSHNGELYDFTLPVKENLDLYASFERSKSAICLCFDDYYEEWDYIIDRYEDVIFNFFISGHLYPGDERVAAMVANGHNIGNHTQAHSYIHTIPNSERDDFLTNDILVQKEAIESYGVKNDCFAFPFGAFDRDWELRLQKIFRKLRRFGTSNNEPFYYSNYRFDASIIISASSIDNIKFSDDTAFYEYIDGLFDYLVKNPRTTVCLVTHSIWANDWGITLERLDYLISKAKECNISFIKM